jgi:lipid-A-disaccharide synthase
MLASAAQLREKLSQCRFLLPLAATAPAALVERLVSDATVPVAIHQGQTYEIMAAADLALVASGTATLETALLGTPMVIVYRLSSLTYYIGRLLIRVPHIGMVNLLAEEGLFPELIQHDVTPARITNTIMRLIHDPEQLARISAGLKRIRYRLGGEGASTRAAAVALDLLRKSKMNVK